MPENLAQPGAAVLISAPAAPELLVAVVLAHGDDTLSIAPVSTSVQHATEWDLLLAPDVLGYDAMVEIWNFGSALTDQIAEVITVLPPACWQDVRTLAGAAARSEPVPAGLPVGPAVIDDADPRLLFQDAQAEAAQPYWEPTLALAGAATLGQLVAHRRAELGIAPADLEQASGRHGWLTDLETDHLDVGTALPARSLAAIMRRLRIGRSRRLLDIARWTIEAQGAPAGAMARKGQGHGDASDIDAYLAELADALDDPPAP